ncbi:class II aldolase/adducin family protein, partial [Weissella confusa]|nr:class II aldolase/adducin family protein [Weissella confusa]
MKFIDSKFMRDICNVTKQSYDNGWDERNGGNISIRITEDELKDFDDVKEVKRTFDLGFDAKAVAGQYFLVTGTGRYFRNVIS